MHQDIRAENVVHSYSWPCFIEWANCILGMYLWSSVLWPNPDTWDWIASSVALLSKIAHGIVITPCICNLQNHPCAINPAVWFLLIWYLSNFYLIGYLMTSLSGDNGAHFLGFTSFCYVSFSKCYSEDEKMPNHMELGMISTSEIVHDSCFFLSPVFSGRSWLEQKHDII